MTSTDTHQHWEGVYGRRAATEVSWYEADPSHSLAFIAATGAATSAPIVDIGGGASLLVDRLLDRGYTDVTVLDISSEALSVVRDRLGPRQKEVTLLPQDIRMFAPTRRYAIWHDRAVFHFLTEAADREHYRRALVRGTSPGSHVVMATFGPQGPERCSGLSTCRYGADALASALGNSFKLEDSLLTEHTTPAGGRQQFLYARFLRI